MGMPFGAVMMFQHTAARRRLVAVFDFYIVAKIVSTHSRPKAAGCPNIGFSMVSESFNTQPPEGGWILTAIGERNRASFNTQPPEGGWFLQVFDQVGYKCFNTQPPEGGWQLSCSVTRWICGFNTQPPEGGWWR